MSEIVGPGGPAAPDWSALPVPQDDGAAAHLPGAALPALALPATGGGAVDLSALVGTTIIYAYPMTGTPGVSLPDDWDTIPGARGCTPQSCAFRDEYADLCEAGAEHVFGLSAQTPSEQAEAAARLHLPFPLLSDAEGRLAAAMDLPRFTAGGRDLLRRLTLVVRDGIVVHVFYPVFPPDSSASDVLDWLRAHG